VKIIKGFLIDIDGTLFDYNTAHASAMQSVISFMRRKFRIGKKVSQDYYYTARGQIHLELKETAASHNRLLYFQRMLELLKINSLQYAKQLDTIYWHIFLDNMQIYPGVHTFLNKVKNKICFVTDLTADIQYRKIHKLSLFKYADRMVTSEEAGIEKPHPDVFLSALRKLKLHSNEVVMIGDNYEKDIRGAVATGIKAIWFNPAHKKSDMVPGAINLNSFAEIMEYCCG